MCPGMKCDCDSILSWFDQYDQLIVRFVRFSTVLTQLLFYCPHITHSVVRVRGKTVFSQGGKPAIDGAKLSCSLCRVQQIQENSKNPIAVCRNRVILSQMFSSTNAVNIPFDTAPTLVACTLPSLKIIMVGIPRIL